MQGLNLKSYGISRSSIDESNDLSSHEGLLREYKKLNIQLKQLQILEKRTKDQLANLQDEDRTIEEEIELYSNLDVFVVEIAFGLCRSGNYVAIIFFIFNRCYEQKQLRKWKN